VCLVLCKQVFKSYLSTGWIPSGSNIKARGSTVGNSVVLEAERNFLREGIAYFEFSLLTDNGEPLSFVMDDRVLMTWNHTTVQGKTSYSAPVPKGTHVFKWKYAPFVSDGKVCYLSLSLSLSLSLCAFKLTLTFVYSLVSHSSGQ